MEHTTQKVDSNVNDGLIISNNVPCRVINCNKCMILMQDVNNRETEVREELGGIYGKSVLSAQFFYNPKTALRNEVY